MNDRQLSDLIWSFITGVIVGFIILGIVKLVWWLLKALWAVLVWFINLVQGKRQQRRVATFERADALEAQGRLDEAAEIYRALARSGDEEVRAMALFSLGWVLEVQGVWDESVAAYEAAIARRQPEVTPLAMLGVADVLYLGKDARKEAAVVYRELLRPGRLSLAERADRESLVRMASKSLASLLYEEGELREAEGLCRGSIAADASEGEHDLGLTIGLARILARQGKVDDALLLLSHTEPTEPGPIGSRRGCPLYYGDSLDEIAAEIGAAQRAG